MDLTQGHIHWPALMLLVLKLWVPFSGRRVYLFSDSESYLRNHKRKYVAGFKHMGMTASKEPMHNEIRGRQFIFQSSL